jgi:hypothetical protein
LHGDIENGLSWRTGVVLFNKKFESRALVRADEEEARIDIVVSGEQKKDYLGIIIYTFRTINESFRGLNCIERVPLPDDPHIAVGYEHLLKLERGGLKEYFPDGAAKAYSVQSLLGHVQPDRTTDEQIIELLKALHAKGDTEESLLGKAEKALILKPNFFGVGVDLNHLVEMFFGRARRARSKKNEK